MKTIANITLLLCLSAAAVAGDLPNPALTPGATNAAVTADNLHQTICVRGYTKTIRPDAAYTNRLKKGQIREYGYADRNPRHYEEDHLIPLELGGNPTDPRNLWPQPRISEWGADKKDQLENEMHHLVCSGRLSLSDAQIMIRTNWITAYRHVFNLL